MRIKKITSLLLGIFLAANLSGCQASAPVQSKPTSSASVAASVPATESFCTELLTQLAKEQTTLESDTICGYADKDFALYFEQLYGLDASYVSDGCILYQASGGSADEISLLTPVDAGKGAAVKAALQSRAEQRIRDFTGYNDAEAQKAANAAVIPLGSRFALIISEHPTETAKALRQLLRS